MMAPRQSWVRSVGLGEILIFLSVLLLVGGVWGFIELTDEVKEGGTQRFDDWAVRALRQPDNPAQPIGPRWLPEVGRDLTALGGVAVLTLVTLAVVLFLLIGRRYGAMSLVIASTLGGLVLSSALKHLIDRPRPALVPHLSAIYTSSFPSGHSMLSATVYLTLGALLARFVQGWASKVYFIAVALTLTFLVGVSRIYMGVHYPTDVLGGYAAAVVWVSLVWTGYHWWRRKAAIPSR